MNVSNPQLLVRLERWKRRASSSLRATGRRVRRAGVIVQSIWTPRAAHRATPSTAWCRRPTRKRGSGPGSEPMRSAIATWVEAGGTHVGSRRAGASFAALDGGSDAQMEHRGRRLRARDERVESSLRAMTTAQPDLGYSFRAHCSIGESRSARRISSGGALGLLAERGQAPGGPGCSFPQRCKRTRQVRLAANRRRTS